MEPAKKITIYCDPEKSWLRISPQLATRLGIKDEISELNSSGFYYLDTDLYFNLFDISFQRVFKYEPTYYEDFISDISNIEAEIKEKAFS